MRLNPLDVLSSISVGLTEDETKDILEKGARIFKNKATAARNTAAIVLKRSGYSVSQVSAAMSLSKRRVRELHSVFTSKEEEIK